MKKFLYLLCVCAACWWLYDSCSDDSGKSESSSYKSETKESKRKSGKFQYTSLTDPSSLLGLLDGKTFNGYKGTSGQVTFNRSGGRVDGVSFTISSVQIINDKAAKFSYYVPGYNMSGYFAVVITDDEITIHDSNGSNFIYE